MAVGLPSRGSGPHPAAFPEPAALGRDQRLLAPASVSLAVRRRSLRAALPEHALVRPVPLGPLPVLDPPRRPSEHRDDAVSRLEPDALALHEDGEELTFGGAEELRRRGAPVAREGIADEWGDERGRDLPDHDVVARGFA